MSEDPDEAARPPDPPAPEAPEAWVIPGVPPAAVHRAEREAARRGMTLGAWLEEAIEHAILAERSGPPPEPLRQA